MKNDTSQELFLSTAELARRWKLHPETIRRKISRGELISTIVGRKHLIDLDQIRRKEGMNRV